jgi:ech hydrogenase subunit F
MSSFNLTRMSLRNLVHKPATKMYPTVPLVPKERTKGHVVNDIETCILCGICQKRCPTLAITVDKPNRTWTIDPFACVQCKTCVRACPKKSLTMDNNYIKPSAKKYTHTEHKPEEQPAEAPAA